MTIKDGMPRKGSEEWKLMQRMKNAPQGAEERRALAAKRMGEPHLPGRIASPEKIAEGALHAPRKSKLLD